MIQKILLNLVLLFQIINSNDLFSAIIDTQSKISVLGIPLTNYDSAPIRCEIRPEQGLWVITKMFIE
ncbi:hypothetical protein [Planktothrix agardhii]|jgi:hypothetical protein|uniref:hypothetical protein n=1 Tax=Planktothrix agardhii TaxID=1160 RepID=UPI001D0AE4E8|nr:hypothetical protein [Planktothrix agardhii]MCB8758697.1 hypothetical protein [Planktothrix agardhii 1813]